jgi:curved DNA-binding protein CbpA
MIKEAYHDKVRAYHPDRITSMDLPDDMTHYANDMLSRFNTAYETLMQRFQSNAEELKTNVR